MSKQMIIKVTIILVIIVLGLGVWKNQKKNNETIPNQEISIATMPFSFTGYTINIANQKGFFKDHGLNVQLKTSYSNGKQTLAAMIKGEADFAVSSETPFIHAVMKGDPIYVIATMITAQNHLGLVARKDKGINLPKDLENKKIGVTIGSNGEYFLDLVLTLNKVEKSSIQIVNVKPAQMVSALVNGDVDAIATWNPLKIQAIKKMGEKVVLFTVQGIYSPYFIISAKKEYVRTHPEVVKRVVQSLHKASQYILSDPTSSRQFASRFLKIDDAVLEEMSASYSFNIALEPSFLLTLEDQTRWANNRNKNSVKKVPNYLEYIYTDALKKVAPESMIIIK